MQSIITESPTTVAGPGRLSWRPIEPHLPAFFATPTTAGLGMVAQTYDGRWQAIAFLRGPDGSLDSGPAWFSVPLVARHAAQRWAEQAIATGHCPEGAEESLRDGEATA